MSNLAVRSRMPEPSGHDSGQSRETRLWTSLATSALHISACALLFLSLFAYLQNPLTGILRSSLSNLTGFCAILLLLAAAYARPRLVLFLTSAALLAYLQLYQVPRLVFSTAVYLLLCGTGSYLAARRLLRKSLMSLAAIPGSIALLTNLIFFSVVFLHSFILLGAAAYTPGSLMAFGALWAAALLVLERKHLLQPSSYDSAARKPTIDFGDSLGNFLAAACGILALFSAFMYFYPGALTSDANKGYLAIAKFFVRSNSLLIEEPAFLRMNMKAFPHMQEMILSAGFLLGKNIGAKLLAWLIVLAKFHALYFVGLQVLRFTKKQALFAVLLFGLAPLMLELHAVVRPENLLTVFSLYLIFALERTLSAIREKESDKAIPLLALAGTLGLLSISVKYTAFFLLVACAAIYWRVLWFGFRNLLHCLRVGWLPLTLAAVVGGFWYLRNFLLWDQLVSMVPRGTYHLTVWFPPLRTISEIWTFLISGLVRTRTYTEFPDFAYGPIGWLIIPALLLGLRGDGRLRRISGVTLLYGILLLSCSRQIRYLAIILPFAYLALIAAAASLEKSFLPALTRRGIQKPLCFAIAAISSFIALQVNQGELAVVGPGFFERISLGEKNFAEISNRFPQINRHVPYPNLAMTSTLDYNYEIDASLYRVDPIRTLGKIKNSLTQFPFSHFLTNDFFIHTPEFYLFGDREFIQSLGAHETTSGSLRMVEIDTQRVQQLFNYLKRLGWNADRTLVVSEPHWKRHPFMFERGEQLNLPDLPHRLYRVTGLWESRGYYSFDSTPTFQPGARLGWYFEDLDSSSELGRKNLTTKITSEGLKKTVSQHGIPGVVLSQDNTTGRQKYLISLPKGLENGPLVAELHVRTLRALPDDQLFFILGDQRIEYPLHNSLLQWKKLGEYRFEAGSLEELPVEVEFRSPSHSSATFFRDLRIIFRRPNQRRILLHENFIDPLHRTSGLFFSSQRDGVTVNNQAEMVLEPGKPQGFKSYRFFLPEELGQDITVQVFARGIVKGDGTILKLQLKTPHAEESVASSRMLAEWSSTTSADQLLSYSFKRRAAVPGAKYDVEVELELSGASETPRIEELTILAGQF